MRPDNAGDLLAAIDRRGGDESWIIGKVIAGDSGRIVLT